MFRAQKVLLVAALVAASAPGPVVAGGPAAPFVAFGPVLTIDAGDVQPAGKSGRYAVKDREVTGVLYGAIGGQSGEPYSFTFGTNVPLLSQSGQIHGTLTTGGYEAAVHATSQIGATQIPCPDELVGTPWCLAGYILGLLLNGTFTLTAGAQGHGTATGWLIPNIDPATGHIVGVLGGTIELTGQWQP